MKIIFLFLLPANFLSSRSLGHSHFFASIYNIFKIQVDSLKLSLHLGLSSCRLTTAFLKISVRKSCEVQFRSRSNSGISHIDVFNSFIFSNFSQKCIVGFKFTRKLSLKSVSNRCGSKKCFTF